MSESAKNIFQALAAVNREIDAIGKNSRNQQQGFNFRGIDDAYNALHGLLAKHGIVTLPRVIDREYSERTTKNGGALFVTKLMVEYTFAAEDGSSIVVGPVLGEAMDSGDKGANKALAIAHKYVLFQAFTIPTLFSDPDEETHEVAPPPVPAEERQLAIIADHIEAGSVPESGVAWFEKHRDTLTREQAAAFIGRIKAKATKET